MAARTLAESPRSTLPLDETEAYSYPSEQTHLAASLLRPRPLAYNVLVRDVMTREVVTVAAQATLLQAALLMYRHHVTGLPVVGGRGRLLGVITESDVLRDLTEQVGTTPLGAFVGAEPFRVAARGPDLLPKIRSTLRRTRVRQAMTPDPVTVAPSVTLEEACRQMIEHRVNRLPVVERTRLVGILSREDVVRAVPPRTLEERP